MESDLHFYFDPVCPFAWMTSKWVRIVAAHRAYHVDWRFISLRILNANVDYAAHFPPEYEAGHTAGLRLLRVVARVREEHGRDAVGPLYSAIGTRLFDTPRTEKEEPLARTGRDVGTPILHFKPPGGTACFGPVISRLPSRDDAVELWDHVIALTGFPGFAEIKRSLRERPQLAGLGVDAESVGVEEDWHGGSRRRKR